MLYIKLGAAQDFMVSMTTMGPSQIIKGHTHDADLVFLYFVLGRKEVS